MVTSAVVVSAAGIDSRPLVSTSSTELQSPGTNTCRDPTPQFTRRLLFSSKPSSSSPSSAVGFFSRLFALKVGRMGDDSMMTLSDAD